MWQSYRNLPNPPDVAELAKVHATHKLAVGVRTASCTIATTTAEALLAPLLYAPELWSVLPLTHTAAMGTLRSLEPWSIGCCSAFYKKQYRPGFVFYPPFSCMEWLKLSTWGLSLFAVQRLMLGHVVACFQTVLPKVLCVSGHPFPLRQQAFTQAHLEEKLSDGNVDT